MILWDVEEEEGHHFGGWDARDALYKYFYRANTLVRPTCRMAFTGAVASYGDLRVTRKEGIVEK